MPEQKSNLNDMDPVEFQQLFNDAISTQTVGQRIKHIQAHMRSLHLLYSDPAERAQSLQALRTKVERLQQFDPKTKFSDHSELFDEIV